MIRGRRRGAFSELMLCDHTLKNVSSTMPDASARAAAGAYSPLPGTDTDPAAQHVSTPFDELRRRLPSAMQTVGDWTPAEKKVMQANATREAHELATAPRWDGASCARCSIVPLKALGALKRPPGCPDASHPAAFCGACLQYGAMKIGDTQEDATLLASLWCSACREG